MTKKGYIYDDQGALFGGRDVVGFGSDDWNVKEIDKALSKELIIKNHYSKKCCNDATTHIHLGVFINGDLLGVLQIGYAMNPQSCGSVVEGTSLNQYKELNRMWLDDKAPRNSESRAISYAIKYIKQKYRNVKWIQSFADERCGGLGIVYQAANFKYFGEHTSVFWSFEGETYHNSLITNGKRNKKAELEARGFYEKAEKEELRQFRYIYFIDNRWSKKCLLEEKPYLKYYNGD
jgi:adenine modification enzyme